MKAEEFFEKQMANIRELWHLSDLQKKTVYILMEEYAALHIADVVLHIADVVRRSEQLVCPDCKLPFTKEELQIKEHCFNCGWEFAN